MARKAGIQIVTGGRGRDPIKPGDPRYPLPQSSTRQAITDDEKQEKIPLYPNLKA